MSNLIRGTARRSRVDYCRLSNKAALPHANWFVFFVQWAAIILSALAGLYVARKRGMDFFGSMVIAFIVSLGGGTLQDMLLGRYPVFWLAEPIYAVTVLVIALLSILVEWEAERNQTVARVAQPLGRVTDEQSGFFIVIDALALGLWAENGHIAAGRPDYGGDHRSLWRCAARRSLR